MFARVVEQDAAHLGSGDGHEVAAAFERGALIHQTDVGFVHQGGGLHGVLAAFAAEIGAREAVQFVIDQRQKVVNCVLLSASDFPEEASDFAAIAQGGFFHRLWGNYIAWKVAAYWYCDETVALDSSLSASGPEDVRAAAAAPTEGGQALGIRGQDDLHGAGLVRIGGTRADARRD